MNVETVITNVIGELTDFDIDTLTEDTLISDIHLVSLDYVSIQVALKKELGIAIDVNKLPEINLSTLGDLYTFCRNEQA
ncbi:phosphopantetheine-binding protein [Pseudomonas sp. 15FMM2]|uniref:Phosphopantetheine-binding protein n=2 Tax=Pseudomonas imrae TaxID=2992837 RepID=A0ACC7P6U2_9PSED